MPRSQHNSQQYHQQQQQHFRASNATASSNSNNTMNINRAMTSMRKRRKNSNIANNSKRSRNVSSVDDLVTQRQQAIHAQQQGYSSSQATQYTHATTTNRSQSNLTDKHLFIYQQQLQKQQQQGQQIFINKQQQKMIHTILQIARKGKINHKNAFQIPLKLATQQVLHMQQHGKFWKFASQLLGTSINIFDKRIQNTWISTNAVHQKLARLNMQKHNNNNSNGDDDDQQMFMQQNNNTNSKKRNHQQVMVLDIQQFKKADLLQGMKQAQATLSDTDKISIKKLEKQFDADPTFFKKLRTFDNSSHNSLLLNVFNLGPECEIQLFESNRKLTAIVSQSQNLSWNSSSQLETPLSHLQQLIYSSVHETCQQKYFSTDDTIFKKISVFQKYNLRQIKTDTKNVKKQQNNKQQTDVDFTEKGVYFSGQKQQQGPVEGALRDQELQRIFQQQFQNVQQLLPGSTNYENRINGLNFNTAQIPAFEIDSNDNNYNSQQQPMPYQRKNSQQQHFNYQSQNLENNQYHPHSQNNIFGSYNSSGQYSNNSQYNNNDHSFHSVMTPWQMQFKDGKLLRKRVPRKNINRENINMKKREKVQPGFVQFDEIIVQKKDEVFKAVAVEQRLRQLQQVADNKSNKSKNSKKSKDTKNKIKNKNSSNNSQLIYGCNLLPPQMVTFQKYNYQKYRVINSDQQQQFKYKQQQQIASFLALDPSVMHIPNINQLQQQNKNKNTILQTAYQYQQTNTNPHTFSPQANTRPHNINSSKYKQYQLQLQSPSKYPHPYMHHNNKTMNIRELKKTIYNQVSDQRYLKLSEMDIDVHPSNILITFLHLANQRNLVVKGNQDDNDVILSWD